MPIAMTTVLWNTRLIAGTGRDPKPGMAAIVCATSANAKLFRMGDSIGTVEEGKLADLILVDGNPVDDISVLESADNVKLVMKEGAVMKRLLP